jgi:hypothetical protein
VLGLLAEDDDDELWRRQVRINAWLGSDMDELGNLHLQGRAGLENTLAVYPANGPPAAQQLYELVRAKAAELKPVLIILDPIAQLFGGNENDRFQVSHFVNLVGGLAREFDCAVLLLGHPAKAEGSEYSGSTAWNGSVRSRLLLQRKEGEEDQLVLTRAKGNYAKLDSLALRWVDGILKPSAPEFMTYADKLDAQCRAGRCRTAVPRRSRRPGRARGRPLGCPRGRATTASRAGAARAARLVHEAEMEAAMLACWAGASSPRTCRRRAGQPPPSVRPSPPTPLRRRSRELERIAPG